MRLSTLIGFVYLAAICIPGCGDGDRRGGGTPRADGGARADGGVNFDASGFDCREMGLDCRQIDCFNAAAATSTAAVECWRGAAACAIESQELRADCFDALGDSASAEFNRCCGSCAHDFAICFGEQFPFDSWRNPNLDQTCREGWIACDATCSERVVECPYIELPE